MKKLTAGIFTVLLGVVAANSADAALTSQKYVDAKVKVNADAIADLTTTVGTKADASTVTDLSGKVTANTEAIAKKADQTAMETALAGKQQKLTSTNFKKDGTGNVISGVTVDESGNVTFETSTVATAEGLENLTNTVAEHTTALGTLNGTAETTGSVANKIAAAITAETTRADGAYDAKGAATTAETNAKAYADGLAKNYATADQGKKADSALQKTGTLTAGNLLTTDASGNIIDAGKKGALAALDTVDKANLSEGVQASLDKADSALQAAALNDYAKTADVAATYETITNSNAIKDTADANKTAIATLNGTGDGSVSKAVADAKTELTTAIGKKQNTLTAADVTVSGGGNVITGITAADGKITATLGTTLGALATAAPGECSEATKFCALTFNGTTYKWEVIERVDGE